MNNVTLIGRLTKDVEMHKSQSGLAIGSFTLAVDRPVQAGHDKQADFIPIVTFGKQAENCGKYIGKGRLVAINGRIQTRSYEKDGQKRYVTEVIANTVQFLDKPKDDAPVATLDGFDEFAGLDEELPF